MPNTTELRRVIGVFQYWLRHSIDPRILFPFITLVLLLVIWVATLSLVRSHYHGARQDAATSTVDLAQTYEAQVVRALREIDLGLKVVKYAYEDNGDINILSELHAHALLPPVLLFAVSIADGGGNIVAATHTELLGNNVAEKNWFTVQRDSDTLAISRPSQDPGSGAWSLNFSRRLSHRDGSFAGVAIISVDPAYFVSNYELAMMGNDGVLGLLGTDGNFRVRRTGGSIVYRDAADYAAEIAALTETPGQMKVMRNPWDEVRRYTVIRTLYAFPLALVVGLAEQEQLAVAYASGSEHFWQALVASVLVILVMTLLGRLSWQLQQSRQLLLEEQVAHTKRVEHLAYHDSLTGLPNRSLFSTLLNQSINQARRYRRTLSVLFLDLDGFKQINDTLGHDVGDSMLRGIAGRLTGLLRDSDTIARLGGDEFVILLQEMIEEQKLAAIATKILAAAGEPFSLEGEQVSISVSIGISRFPQDGEDEQTLVKAADIAMYNAKDAGKNIFRFYTPDMNAGGN